TTGWLVISRLSRPRTQHRRALEPPFAQIGECCLRLRQGVLGDGRLHWMVLHESQEFERIASSEVGDGLEAAYTPKDRVRERGKVRHVNSRPDHGASGAHSG